MEWKENYETGNLFNLVVVIDIMSFLWINVLIKFYKLGRKNYFIISIIFFACYTSEGVVTLYNCWWKVVALTWVRYN